MEGTLSANQPAVSRDLLIALNAVMGRSREVVCRLSATVSAWIAVQPPEISLAARRLRIPAPRLRDALALLPRVSEVASIERARCCGLGVDIVTRLDPDYPSALFDLALPPPVLYCRGHLDSRPAMAIVGSRRSDPYGLEVAELFSSELSRQGLSIVSGLAVGIDAAAHRGALNAGGHTLAVLGCGIDIAYPRSNRRLAADLGKTGAVISEFPLGSPPKAWHFPVRNRIIAAVSIGTLVIRATPRSGSLITAGHALELGRNVFAIPGTIFDRRSIGPNCLIRDGAIPVQHPREIIESLPTSVQMQLTQSCSRDTPEPQLDEGLATVLHILPVGEAISQEDVISSSGLPLDRTLAALLELELGGWIERHPGALIVRRASSAESRWST
ncbi:MAG: DNA-processing protein DprA [Acidobacteriota bacterium]|nr:DNA-processing protein DprA [Acidobacteriota bacterium]